MPLLDLRKSFITYSGRYDLVIDQIDWMDNGADYFIQSGQRWLDRFSHIYKADARYYVNLKAGDWYTLLPSRTVREVWISNETGKKWKLHKEEYKHLRKRFRSNPATITPSKPLYYAVTPIRTIPEVNNLTLFDIYDGVTFSNQYYADFVHLRTPIDDIYTLLIDSAHQLNMLYGVAPDTFQGARLKDKYNGATYHSLQMTAFNNPDITVWLTADLSGQLVVETSQPVGSVLDVGKQLDLNSVVMTADYVTATTIGESTVHIGDDITPDSHYANTGIVFLPPSSDGMVLEILGAFLQPKLTTDDSMNFWTEEEPHILVMAACRALEISYRNKEGVADWEAAIKQEILGLELDFAELESNEFTQMEG